MPTEQATLQHAAETAGHLMAGSCVLVGPSDTIGTALRRAGEADLDVGVLLGVDEEGLYRGVIPLRALLSGNQNQAELAHGHLAPDWPSVGPDQDQERVAELARARRLSCVPVVDATGRVLGVVTAARLLDVLWQEHTEDMHRIAGILKPLDMASHALADPPMLRALRRLPWLGVGLLGSALATGLMAGFEARFQENVRLAFFVPAIVYLADAIGTQTEAVAVRGLSLADRPFRELILGETAAGALIGLVLAVLVFVGVSFSFQDMRLALVVAVTVLCAGVVAASVGLSLPWLLSRTGVDPAFGSGPLATILQDVLSIVIYFLAVLVLL